MAGPNCATNDEAVLLLLKSPGKWWRAVYDVCEYAPSIEGWEEQAGYRVDGVMEIERFGERRRMGRFVNWYRNSGLLREVGYYDSELKCVSRLTRYDPFGSVYYQFVVEPGGPGDFRRSPPWLWGVTDQPYDGRLGRDGWRR